MPNNKPYQTKQKLFGGFGVVALGLFFLVVRADFTYAQLMDLADLPVTTVSTAPTNILITIDNDESTMGSASSEPNTDWSQTYSRSAQFNKYAYNPRVTYTPPVDANGQSVGDADFNNAQRDYYSDSPNTFDLANNYRTVTHIEDDQSRFADEIGCTAGSCSAYYYLHLGFGSCNAVGVPDDDFCYLRINVATSFLIAALNGRSLEQEKTNFANWYQFYATRIDAAKTGLRLAFSPENVDSHVRVGRQTVGRGSDIRSATGATSVDGVTSFADQATRESFFQWITEVELINNTEIRESVERAGEYIQQEQAYLEERDNSDSLQTCRRNEHVLLSAVDTDPGDDPDGSYLNANGAMTLPDGKAYSSAAYPEFSASSEKSIENLVFHFWAVDANSDNGDDDVPTLLEPGLQFSNLSDTEYFNPANDPASWQHLRTSVVNFGSDNAGGADLEQAAINGRGQFVSPSSIEDLIGEIASLVSVPDGSGSLSAVATSSGRAAGEELIFTAEFDTELKIGRLKAQKFSDGSEFVRGQVGSSCNEKIFGTICSEEWDASRENTEGSPSFGNRKIISYNPTRSNGERGVDFEFGNLSTGQQTILNDGNGDDYGRALLDYIAGDTSNEQGSGDDLFRKRSGPDFGSNTGITYLGPIVNSSPVFVSDGEDDRGVRTFNFSDDLETDSYSDFVSETIADRPDLILVGANDGMLHAYEARDGKEVMSYVPNIVLENLPDYANPAYGHKAFVDGPLSYQDAYVDGEWKTILIGGLRTGGQGYFALDISELRRTNVDADDIVMWEFSDKSEDGSGNADAENLGYSFAEAQIVRTHLNGGEWVALIPSGYNSTEADGNQGSGRASLFVVDLSDGKVLKEIEVGGAADNLTEPNGLSGIAAVTVEGNVNVEYAYAGDLKGRIWKFDLRSSSIGDWSAGLLYDAGDDRPITSKPVVGRRPDGGSGQMVYFGTGQLLQNVDISNSDQQAFYGVLDDQACDNIGSPCVSEGDLVEQSLSGSSQRAITSNSVDYATDKGFFIELDDSGSAERVVAEPVLVGATVAFVSVDPQNSGCGTGVENYLNVVSRFTGGAPANPPLVDSRGEPLVVGSAPVVGIKLDNEYPLQAVTLLSAGDGKVSFNAPLGNPAGDLGATGRLRWRQLR